MRATLAIARSTIAELLRQRLLIVPIIGVVLSLLALGGTLLISDGPVELERAEAEVLAWTSGIAAAIGGAIYAIIVGASLIAREISSGTLLMLAVRPIPRWQIVAGRALGAAVFIVVALLGTVLVYGAVASLVTGMLAPFEEPLEGLASGLPAVLLALCVGIAFSVQARATAAIGSAVGVCAFALFLASYVSSWNDERHLRGYLRDDVRERIDPNDPLVGPVAALAVRALPFGVFASFAEDHFTEEVEPEYHANIHPAGSVTDGSDPRTIDVANSVYGVPASGIDPATGLPGPGIEEPRPLPAAPPRHAFDCAEYGGAGCFLGYTDAWKQKKVPVAPDLHEDGGFWFALLAIPFWIVVAAVLLTRRRDLTS